MRPIAAMNPWIISRRPVNGKWTIRTRVNREYLGTVEPLVHRQGGRPYGYRAVSADGLVRVERIRLFACSWLASWKAIQ